MQRLFYPFVLGPFAVAAWLLGSAWMQRGVEGSSAAPEVQNLERAQDPVILAGSQLSMHLGVALEDLVLYRYRSGAWEPVPFQIDEVDVTGTLVADEDGIFDGNDQLVFMAADGGESAAPDVWPDDIPSQLAVRYGIHLTDPLDPGAEARLYLFRSPTLPRSGQSYVLWDEALQTISAISYTAAFTPDQFAGLADLMINGNNVDILDRQKVRAVGKVFGFTVEFNEEELIDYITPTLTLPAVGPVRAAANEGMQIASFYGSRMELSFAMNTSEIGIPFFQLDSVRTSLDWLPPGISGINTYYDSNLPSGVPIDGSADSVPATPALDWYQVNGDTSGPGGVVFAFPIVEASGGSFSNYYKDDSALDPDDTGDQRSYGDAGLTVSDPGERIEIALVAYILPPGMSENAGSTYFSWAETPLLATVTAQFLPPTAEIYLPIVIRE